MGKMARYVIGIDLGTTNSALAYVDLEAAGPEFEIKIFEIPQLVGAGRVAQRRTLPSFLYLPGEYELDPDALSLPWDQERRFAVGAFARDQGALVPGRLVSSAKSWLCHGGVDRDAKILPWGAQEGVEKVSPVEASARYLSHLREAWNYVMARDDPDAALEKQIVIVTVPASFDEVARELTLKAAKKAGLEDVILLEEPVAALYAWLSQHEKSWQKELSEGERVLVCDVGGGTSDFTVVEVKRGPEGLSLERIAVGDHILLGGDNMDLAIARLVERKLPKARLDFARFQTLTFLCRELKEKLLALDGPEEDAVRLPGRGTSLIADTLVARVSKKEVLDLILKEFFPEIEYSSALSRVQSVPHVLPEWGLPFARDPAVTRHLAAFLYRHRIDNIDVILFNGGALKPKLLRERIRKEVAKWFGRKDVRELETVSLDLAVSIGAAYYGLVRQGLGIRVGGGIPRAYYLGVIVDGKTKGICLVPKGTKEGERLILPKTFKVLTNRPVKFPIYTSSLREDRLGDVVELSEEFISLPSLTTVLKFGKKSGVKEIPVELEAYLSEIGILETYCRSLETPHRWRLQFALRELELKKPESPEGVLVKPEEPTTQGVDKEQERLLRELLTKAFEDRELLLHITHRLEEALEMERDRWPLLLLRTIADILIEKKDVRKRTALHEARWINLTGFCLRPGYGEAMDPFRIRKLWSLYFEGLTHQRDKACRLEWWIFWRRIAGGLNRGQQEQFFAKLKPYLLPVKGKAKISKQPKVSPQERIEIWLCVANFERLDSKTKEKLATQLLLEMNKKIDRRLLLAFSRLVARALLYGPANAVIPATQAEVLVKNFLELLVKKDIKSSLSRITIETLINIGRLTGDRVRDLSQEIREKIKEIVLNLGADQAKLKPVFEVVPLKDTEKISLFGEALPLGLKLES